MFASPRHPLLVVAAAVALALTVGTAHAQKTSGSGSRAPGQGAHGGESGKVLLYGTPNNCPPTIACAPREPNRVPRHRRLVRHCDQWEQVSDVHGRTVERCLVR
ncbi:MAG: hypothetical protein ABTQ29_12905 [Siculibacillus sp.]